jgi:hypothetical protein
MATSIPQSPYLFQSRQDRAKQTFPGAWPHGGGAAGPFSGPVSFEKKTQTIRKKCRAHLQKKRGGVKLAKTGVWRRFCRGAK